MQRNLQLKGQLKSAFDIEKIIIRNFNGRPIYLKDIASIKDTAKIKGQLCPTEWKKCDHLKHYKKRWREPYSNFRPMCSGSLMK
jgi:hypothetical protein